MDVSAIAPMQTYTKSVFVMYQKLMEHTVLFLYALYKYL